MIDLLAHFTVTNAGISPLTVNRSQSLTCSLTRPKHRRLPSKLLPPKHLFKPSFPKGKTLLSLRKTNSKTQTECPKPRWKGETSFKRRQVLRGKKLSARPQKEKKKKRKKDRSWKAHRLQTGPLRSPSHRSQIQSGQSFPEPGSALGAHSPRSVRSAGWRCRVPRWSGGHRGALFLGLSRLPLLRVRGSLL